MFTIGALPALMTLWVRRAIPESERWEHVNTQRRRNCERETLGAEELALARITLVDLFADPFDGASSLPRSCRLVPPSRCRVFQLRKRSRWSYRWGPHHNLSIALNYSLINAGNLRPRILNALGGVTSVVISDASASIQNHSYAASLNPIVISGLFHGQDPLRILDRSDGLSNQTRILDPTRGQIIPAPSQRSIGCDLPLIGCQRNSAAATATTIAVATSAKILLDVPKVGRGIHSIPSPRASQWPAIMRE
jgi:hypothetical protein